MTAADAPPFLRTLVQATNAHDLDALVACFGPSYRNETPTHPSRSFDGPQQVRANWHQIFSFVPDVHATVTRWVTHGPETWSEWEMRGTRVDGTPHLMRGVIIFGVHDDHATWARFYLEPVDDAAQERADDPGRAGVDAAVARQVHAGATTSDPT